jgi:hypothetical protein
MKFLGTGTAAKLTPAPAAPSSDEPPAKPGKSQQPAAKS